MVVSALLAGNEHHAYGHSHHSCHEAHPLDDCLGWNQEPEVHYVWVGEGKGRYRERGYGQYDYVGPCKGDHEKEILPPDHTMRYLGWCCCFLMLALVAVVLIKALLEDPPFDCQVHLAEFELNWSEMKKEWCCENQNLGCSNSVPTATPDFSTTPAPPQIPDWLRLWLADMNIGAKFIMTMVLALIVGCGCGGFLLYVYVRYFHPHKKPKTELELMAEVNALLARANVDSRGELSISLAWDSTCEFDLYLVTPDGFAISWERLEHRGGKLEYNVNSGLPIKKHGNIPLEHICWAPYDAGAPEFNPAEGQYEVWAKVSERHVLHYDAHLTVVLTIRGKREIHHHRMVPGLFEKKICTFEYRGPNSQGSQGHSPSHHSHGHRGHH